MPLIQVPVGIAPCHVDFPEEIKTGEKDTKGKPVMRKMERSCKGSVYLRPASTRNLTDDELTWLRTNPDWKKIGRRLHVIKVKKVKAQEEAKAAKPDSSKDPTKVDPGLSANLAAADMAEERKKTDGPGKSDKDKSGKSDKKKNK